MFRFVSEQARSVTKFVSKVLSPRAAADHATHSGLDTALSSSAFDEKLEEAAAESPVRVSAAEGSPNFDGAGAEGSQLIPKPDTPKLRPPTPKGAQTVVVSTEAFVVSKEAVVVSREAFGGVNVGVPEELDTTLDAQETMKKAAGQVTGESLERSPKKMRRLASLIEKPEVKGGRKGVQKGVKPERGTATGEAEQVRTPEKEKQTPKRAARLAEKRTVEEGELSNAKAKRGLETEKEGVTVGTERTAKAAKKATSLTEKRTAGAKGKQGLEEEKGEKTKRTSKVSKKLSNVDEGAASGAGVEAKATPRAKQGRVTKAPEGKGALKGSDNMLPAKTSVEKSVVEKEGKSTPRVKGSAKRREVRAELTTPKKATGVKRKAGDGGAVSDEKTPGRGKGKAAKRGKDEEGRAYLGKRIKVLWEKGVVPGVTKNTWFEGMVTSYSSKSKLHGVQYDDGDFENEDLSPGSATKFEILG